MRHNIITTENYLLVVDDSEININQYVYCDLGYIEKVMDIINGWVYHTKMLGKNPIKHYKKIIAHLPLNNSPILEGVDLLPPLEDEVEKLSMERVIETMGDHNVNSSTAKDMIKIGIDCYNKAKEKYKYTEKQLDDAISWATTKAREGIITHWDIDNFIQSLQQPKMPVGFECEMEDKVAIDGHTIIGREAETTTNSQGLTQWVGEYIY